MSSRVHSSVADLSTRVRVAGGGQSISWTCARCNSRRFGFDGRRRWRGTLWACCAPQPRQECKA